MRCSRLLRLISPLFLVVLLAGTSGHVALAARNPRPRVAATLWETATSGKLKFKIHGFATDKGPADCDILFGPVTDLLGPTELLVEINDGLESIFVLANYFQDSRGKITVAVDFPFLEDDLEALFGEDIIVSLLKAKLKLRAKAETRRRPERMNVKLKVKFIASAVSAVKASLMYKGGSNVFNLGSVEEDGAIP